MGKIKLSRTQLMVIMSSKGTLPADILLNTKPKNSRDKKPKKPKNNV